MNLEKAYSTGLVEVIKDWIKEQKYVSSYLIQTSFSIDRLMADAIFEELIKQNLIEDKSTYEKGNKVISYNPLINMKVYLIDINPKITSLLKEEFKDFEEVEVVEDNFIHFMNNHKNVECVVSPANSFGFMDGGFDKAIVRYFGIGVKKEVRKYINNYLYGEQPVGTSIMVNIPDSNKKLIHTPTMRLPSIIQDQAVVYQCMRVTMMMAINNNIQSIVIPSFGGETGRVDPRLVASYMRQGYQQVVDFLKTHPRH